MMCISGRLVESATKKEKNDMLNTLFWLGAGTVFMISCYYIVSFFFSLGVFYAPGIR